MPAPDRRYRFLLRLLPRAFREEHERELLRVWPHDFRQAARGLMSLAAAIVLASSAARFVLPARRAATADPITVLRSE